MSITQSLLEPLLASGSPRPLVTYYDDRTGARVELSRATTANWAAKTANWLVDELDVEPGMPVAVRLPAHWQTVGALLGAWWCGARVTDDPTGAEVALVRGDADAPDPVRDGEGAYTVAAVGLDALGMPLSDLPDGVVDYSSEIRIHGDEFTPRQPVTGDSLALLDSTVDEVLARARRRASDLGISKDDRVLSTLDWEPRSGVVDGVLAVLAAGASLVQCANLDPAKLEQRRANERTTVELGRS